MSNTEQFVSELDAAIQAHMEWSRRVLRCAVLRTTPGNDVLDIQAHTLCRFGRWFWQHRASFDDLDSERAQLLESAHQFMHGAIRALCLCVLEGEAGEVKDLDIFETTQRQLIDHLAYFKTLAISRNAQIDPLTGLPMRHRMEQDFDILSKLRRHQGDLMVMMVDADHFKAINDQYGHPAGDVVLQQLAATLKQVLRSGDLIYRYGGEEFILLMVSNAVEGTAQRLLEAVRALSITLPDGTVVRITVTIGFALPAEGESLVSAIQRADDALYIGKKAGRNCYVAAAELPNATEPFSSLLKNGQSA